MKRNTILLVFALIILTGQIMSQNYVSPEPQNKNAILEEFTGVRCPNCPAGHLIAATILANNPGRAFLVAYHPFGSNYTTPYAGDPDFRRQYPVSFYSVPYCGSTRFMPSAFINRELWNNGERIQRRTTWTNYTNQILDESSPVNIGIIVAI